MKIGFVTFCTISHVEMLKNLIKSVVTFSKHEILVYCINFDYECEFEQVKIKKLNLEFPSYYNICKTKIFASIDCDLDIGLILDCDMIVTDKIDELFDENKFKIIESEFPLFARHPHRPLETNPAYFPVFKQYTNKIPKINWVYASYMFSKKNIWFLEKVYNEMNKLEKQVGNDELIINALLTEYEVPYDIGYNYLPNGDDTFIKIFFNELEDNTHNNPYLRFNCPVKYYIFHSHKIKNEKYAEELIDKIVTFKQLTK
jgi:hypothetical protein